MKQVEDYLNDGIYGIRKPKHAERLHYLGTLRERIVLVLTKGQVMSDKALQRLEKAMQAHPNTKLLLNGHIPYHFFQRERELAHKYDIPYTSVTNEKSESDIGAVLTYDKAIDIENIFVDDDVVIDDQEVEQQSFLTKIKHWFFPPV
ncbi:YueI family protein [Lentibacillus sp. N15]|uniref:YueI family protein n=1 Tax=Lentibacillus songyuanensis TaxID=3136161 RepID=UPI0031BB3257